MVDFIRDAACMSGQGILKLILYLSFSGNDYMLPSGDEAQRLKSSLKNCTVRYFKDNGHTILLVQDN
jgi:hypothetical protein